MILKKKLIVSKRIQGAIQIYVIYRRIFFFNIHVQDKKMKINYFIDYYFSRKITLFMKLLYKILPM